MRTGAWCKRHVQSAVQQSAEADAAGRMQYSVHDSGRSGQDVEPNCGKSL